MLLAKLDAGVRAELDPNLSTLEHLHLIAKVMSLLDPDTQSTSKNVMIDLVVSKALATSAFHLVSIIDFEAVIAKRLQF